MNNEERYQKYIKEHCKKCKNKETNLCDIRIFVIEKTIYTKCRYYEGDNKNKKKKQARNWQRW